MEKLILLSLIFVGCKKEEDPCNCGLIKSDNVYDYSINIQNECTGNVKKFYLDEGDWMNAHPGDEYCIYNSEKW